MTTLGIIGGIAPPSTIDYYRLLWTRYHERSPDGNYPSILIDSIDAKPFFALLEVDDRPGIVKFLHGELDRLARAGAEIALFASNSPHLVFDEIARVSPLPLISIVEATADVAQAQGLQRLGLLGARYTMDGGFYRDVFAERGIAVVVPDPDERRYIHERYFAEFVGGVFRDETRASFAAVIERMRVEDRIEAVILGGTELPMLFRDAAPTSLPLLDTTSIHVDAAIARLLP